MNQINIEELLPLVSSYVPRAYQIGFGSDYYGALEVAAAYCDLKAMRNVFPGVWQHGCVPPWQHVQPEMVIYGAPRGARCWVARKDQESYLRESGYPNVNAIGLPIIYTGETGSQRLPGSLLIMPMHCIPGDTRSEDSEEYVREIVKLTKGFDVVAACVAGRCIDNGLWVRHFESKGIQVVRGASVDDANSLQRMRTLFETFDYVTTDRWGSHVPYALYFGAKVSLWGSFQPVTRDYLMRDGLWVLFPEAVDRFVAPENQRRAEELSSRFEVEPRNGVADAELGARMVGHSNKLSPRDLQKAFRWGLATRISKTAARGIERSLPWRAGRKAIRLAKKMHSSRLAFKAGTNGSTE
jgi:hypothetical protein